jgi:hypothetical protein
MRRRGVLALGLVASLITGGSAALMASSPALATLPDVTVTMIDTGVRVQHQEFNYVSSTDTTDQVVGWWDFTASGGTNIPALGDTWDTTNSSTPYDDNGHGTRTASAAVGRNMAPAAQKKPSYCPGCKLAVAKVLDSSGSGSLAAVTEAIKWARETIHTDVINVSIGAAVPLPAVLVSDMNREIRLARQAGILVVWANGNGWGNFGLVPGQPGALMSGPGSTYALSVGARDVDGVGVTTDPEVASDYFAVPLATNACNNCYASDESGTSFAAPLVAGFGARLIQENRANGFAGDADYIEKLVKYSARDTLIPPTFEGFGIVDAAQLSGALTHAAAGTLPSRPTPDVNSLYVDTVQGTLRDVWGDKAGEGSQNIVNAGIGTPTALGTIGPSAPTGVSEAEVYKISANRGDVVTAGFNYAPADPLGVNDVDFYVLRIDPTSSLTVPTGSQLVAKSQNAAGVNEAVQFVAPSTGDYYVVALGWSVATPQAINVTSSKPLQYWYQGYVLHTFGTGLFA